MVARTLAVAGPGYTLITSATCDGRIVMGALTLSALVQDGVWLSEGAALHQTTFRGVVETAMLEQSGPVHAVIRLDGVHTNGSRRWLPFSVRHYFTAGSEAVQMVHSFIFDGDATRILQALQPFGLAHAEAGAPASSQTAPRLL